MSAARWGRAEDGQSLVLVALLLAVLAGAVGLALDVGLAVLERFQAQTAADAAALAGAADLPTDPQAAVRDALDYAARNGFANGGGVTVTAATPPGSGPHVGDPAALEVRVTKQAPATLLRILGLGGPTVAARAVGVAPLGAPCAVCVLSPSAAGALSGSGNGQVRVAGAAVVVDSRAASAAVLSGNASVQAQAIGVVGGYSTSGNATFRPTPTTGIPPVPDPLAAVPPPVLTGPNQGSVAVSDNQSRTLEPGVYTDLSVSGNGVLTLDAGTYVLTGSVTISGNGALRGSGVTLYFTCPGYSPADPAPCRGRPGGALSLSGNGVYQLSAPAAGTYQGLTVFYDRGNTAGLSLSGNASDAFTGTVYAPAAAATLSGNGGLLQLNALVVANTVVFSGNGDLAITYDATQNYPVRQAPRLSP